MAYSKEKFLRYDLSNKKSWDKIIINNPSLVNGCQYGVLPLNVDGDNIEFLVFGGIEAKAPYDVLDRTCVFKTNISDFKESKFEMLPSTENSAIFTE